MKQKDRKMNDENKRIMNEWELFSRDEKVYKNHKIFYERWIHRESKSGVVFYSTVSPKSNEVYYIVEGYGIGTIHSETFKEIGDIAPLQHMKYHDLEDAKNGLEKLMKKNLAIWRGRKTKKDK